MICIKWKNFCFLSLLKIIEYIEDDIDKYIALINNEQKKDSRENIEHFTKEANDIYFLYSDISS